MRYIRSLFWLALAGGFFWLFVTRYWLYRDCIAAAASSCITPEGSNLIAGGMFWIVPAVVFAALALRALLAPR